jgi:membrane protein implicated in regulation of membrane protease activity
MPRAPLPKKRDATKLKESSPEVLGRLHPMKNAKLILTALAILIAAIIVWVVAGVVITLVKFLFILAVAVFVISGIRKLSGKSKAQKLEEKDSDRELNEAMRQLEEIKRGQQLIK